MRLPTSQQPGQTFRIFSTTGAGWGNSPQSATAFPAVFATRVGGGILAGADTLG